MKLNSTTLRDVERTKNQESMRTGMKRGERRILNTGKIIEGEGKRSRLLDEYVAIA